MSRARVVVITGASSGIGRTTALRFAARGDSVVLASRRGEALDLLAAECESLGSEALAVVTDVTRSEDVVALADQAMIRFGRIDVWVNNASISAFGPFLDVPLEDVRRVLDVNVMGYIHGARAAMRVFAAQKSGTLINVASIIGELPVPHMSSYSMAKAAVMALSMSLRQELSVHGPRGVHVTTVMPATIDTPFYRNSANFSGHVAMPPPPVYPASVAAKAILRAADHPRRREIVAGPTGRLMVRLHRVMPGVVDGQMATLVDAVRRAGPRRQPDTHGTAFEPGSVADATAGGGWGGRRKYAQRRALFWSAVIGGVVLLSRGARR